MCGRFLLNAPMEALELQFGAVAGMDFGPRFNIAPTNPVPVVKETEVGRVITLHHWGLIPSWAKDPAMGGRLCNARAETLADKPSFRAAFRRRRCLVPASGFYEWQVRPGQPKQPYLIQAVSGEPLAFAGLWDLWEGFDGCLESCTIITTEANHFMAPVHDRMPVVLARADWATWLDPQPRDWARELAPLQALLRPCPEGWLRMHPVGPRVGNVKDDDPGLMAEAHA
jgi:putative SOS response-associated peptidase YedK